MSGTVKYEGKPLPTGTIIFTSEAGGGATGAITDGAYTAVGVPTGPAKVTISTPEPTTMPGQKGGPKMAKKFGPPKGVELPPEAKGVNFNPYESANAKAVPIPKKYGDPALSGLTFTVTSGKNTFDVDLKK